MSGQTLELHNVRKTKRGYVYVRGTLDGETFQTEVKLREDNTMLVKGHVVKYTGRIKNVKKGRFAPNPVYFPDRTEQKERFMDWLTDTEYRFGLR